MLLNASRVLEVKVRSSLFCLLKIMLYELFEGKLQFKLSMLDYATIVTI